jgi:hypothetical protein
LGVVSINFANFEQSQIWVFAAVGAIPETAARMIHAKTGSAACTELIAQIIGKRTDWSPVPIDLVRHFVNASRVLVGNRNILMHSVMTDGWQGKAALYRTSKKGERQMLSATVEQIRAVADDLVTYFYFGHALANRIAILNQPQSSEGAVHPPWPDKPPLPIPLE